MAFVQKNRLVHWLQNTSVTAQVCLKALECLQSCHCCSHIGKPITRPVSFRENGPVLVPYGGSWPATLRTASLYHPGSLHTLSYQPQKEFPGRLPSALSPMIEEVYHIYHVSYSRWPTCWFGAGGGTSLFHWYCQDNFTFDAESYSPEMKCDCVDAVCHLTLTSAWFQHYYIFNISTS